MQIFVRGIDDAVRSLCVPETTTVAELKALLRLNGALLTYGATILDDDKASLVNFGIINEANIDVSFRLLGGKVHGSLARAGKVRAQTPKVEKQEKKKKKTGRAARRIQYNRRFVNIAISGIGRKRGPNSNAATTLLEALDEMSVKLLMEAIKLTDADDNVKSAEVVRKSRPSKAERARQQFAAMATASEYDPEQDDIIVNSNMQRRNLVNRTKKISKVTLANDGTNISLLEECRLRGKVDQLKRNIKYMIYESNRKLDPGTAKKIIDFMDEHDRRRKKILHALRSRNSGVRDHRRKFRKSTNKSIFTDEDFMRIGPDRIKLLQQKAGKRGHLGKQE
ncbi:unnamed protein product [Litomosoides sigmodontis]|uniref:Uncharacterized protein n=1 Tax=Litomosoides sigmodontis TaxID=42156 RepID=A0A3P6UVP2_LITSI|nr:unnamed protein product [Litomosoides sigmodontis]